MNVLKSLFAIWTTICVATILGQCGAAAVLWSKGWLSGKKVTLILGVIKGVDLLEIEQKALPPQPSKTDEQLREVTIRRRLDNDTIINLRRNAAKKDLLSLSATHANLREDGRRFEELKQSFEDALIKLEKQRTETALFETQETLVSLPPKQAKDQLLRMLGDAAEEDIVTIFRLMDLNKRRKIIAEFKTPNEMQKLHSILKDVRLSAAPENDQTP